MPPLNGVTIEFGGETRVLRYTARSLKQLEQYRRGEGLLQTMARAGEMQISAIAALTWAGLTHREPKLSVADVEAELAPPLLGLLSDIGKAIEPWLAAPPAPGSDAEQGDDARGDAEGKAPAAST